MGRLAAGIYMDGPFALKGFDGFCGSNLVLLPGFQGLLVLYLER